MMVMVYNLADTFFSLSHNDLIVAAVSFATPLFMSLGTLFCVGGLIWTQPAADIPSLAVVIIM